MESSIIDSQIIETAQRIFKYLQPYCIAIYLGGSLCQPFIQHPHDVDFICFADAPVNMCHIRRLLYIYQKHNQLPDNYDFIQVRTKQREEHAYGSYINKQMILLVGQEITFDFDVINKHRDEYKQILVNTINDLNTGRIKNCKRWYQILRGYFILLNNSYEVSEQQSMILNCLHDLKPGWEQYKITKELVDEV